MQRQYQAASEIERRSAAISEIEDAKAAAFAARAAVADALEKFVVDTFPPLVAAAREANEAGWRAVRSAQNGALPDAANFPVALNVDARIANTVSALTQLALSFKASLAVR